MSALLTIDDSPSAQTDTLVGALKDRGIPALLFCRGDRLSENPASIIRAIQHGFFIGNHAWSHTRFSTLTLEQGIDEIARTDALIDDAYKKSGVSRPGKYFRFPHIDRGAGGWIVDYDAVPAHRDTLIEIFSGGLNIDLTPPSPALIEKKATLQDYLHREGFVPPPSFKNVTAPWYTETEIANAADCLFTYSTSDWMTTPRHAGKWLYKNLADLKAKIDTDAGLRSGGASIILAHDQDGLADTVIALVDHMLDQGVSFATIA